MIDRVLGLVDKVSAHHHSNFSTDKSDVKIQAIILYYSTRQNKTKTPKHTQRVVFIVPNDCCFQNQLSRLFLKDQNH